MKLNFANYMEADKYLRKHLCLPSKVKHKHVMQAYVVPPKNNRPAIPTLRQCYTYEYHNRIAYVAVVPYEIPVKRGSHWSMETDITRPWHFIDTTTWNDITEDEFIARMNAILKD